MKIVPAGKFKTHCLALLDEVGRTREPIVVTKYGKPVAQVVPYAGAGPEDNPLKHSVVFENDLVSPLDIEWEAAQ